LQPSQAERHTMALFSKAGN